MPASHRCVGRPRPGLFRACRDHYITTKITPGGGRRVGPVGPPAAYVAFAGGRQRTSGERMSTPLAPGTSATMPLRLGAIKLSTRQASAPRPPDPDHRRFFADPDHAKCLELGTARRVGSADTRPRRRPTTSSSARQVNASESAHQPHIRSTTIGATTGPVHPIAASSGRGA